MYNKAQGPVSRNILSLETDLRSLITMATIVFSMLKITRGPKIFEKLAPGVLDLIKVILIFFIHHAHVINKNISPERSWNSRRAGKDI